jgi:hypothetical protein
MSDADKFWRDVVIDRQAMEAKIADAVREFNNKNRALYVTGIDLHNVHTIGPGVELAYVTSTVHMKGNR